jgi:hypothetical protein
LRSIIEAVQLVTPVWIATVQKPEAYGLLSVTTFLHLLEIYSRSTLPVVRTWQLLSLRIRSYPKSIQSSPHVKGHRVRTHHTPMGAPLFQLQLHIQVDALATNSLDTSNHATARGPLAPGIGSHLIIEINSFLVTTAANCAPDGVTTNSCSTSKKASTLCCRHDTH